MLHPFISSRTSRIGNPGVVVASITVHVGLIALALAWPRHPIPLATGLARAVAEHVTYAFNAPLVERLAAASRTRGDGLLAAHSAHRTPLRDLGAGLAALQLTFSPTIPAPTPVRDVDFGGVARHALAFTDSAGGEIAGSYVGGPVPRPDADGAYTEAMVEKTVMPYRDNPRPIYPPELEFLGLEGSFEVMFVVDSTGHVDRHTIRFPERAERLLAQAVRYALERSRYFPAELGGRRVPQLVEQRFVFRMAP